MPCMLHSNDIGFKAIEPDYEIFLRFSCYNKYYELEMEMIA